MPTIKINDKEYDFEKLSDAAKNQLKLLQIADQIIARLNAQLTISQTARSVYAKELEAELSRQG